MHRQITGVLTGLLAAFLAIVTVWLRCVMPNAMGHSDDYMAEASAVVISDKEFVRLNFISTKMPAALAWRWASIYLYRHRTMLTL